ncbi:RuvC family protein, partial [Treponema sp. R6D11]
LQISYQVVDSKKWQKEFLPNIKGSKDLKKASLQRGVERFPILECEIKKHGDADGLFLALYGSAHNL